MNLENIDEIKNFSTQIREKTVDIQHQISKTSSYVDPSYQRLLKEAFAIQREWKQAIRLYFICAAMPAAVRCATIALVVRFCIVRLIGEFGIFVAVPLLIPVTINFGWHGLRLLLQGDPLNEFSQLRQKRRN